MPMIATTIISSIRVKPFCIIRIILPTVARRGKKAGPPSCGRPPFSTAQRHDAGRYFVPTLPPVQVQALPPSLVCSSSDAPETALLTPTDFISACSVRPPVVAAPTLIETALTYLPLVVPMTSDAVVGQTPLSAKYSDSGVLPPAVKLIASDTC